MGEPGSAIVLIHGIGDQAQGSTLSLVQSLYSERDPQIA